MVDRGPRHGGNVAVQWLVTLETFGLCLLYITAFWGQAARLLPPPFDHWHSLLYRAIGPWWHDHVAPTLSHQEQARLYQLVEAMLVAVLLPAWVLHRKGSTIGDAGVRVPSHAAAVPTIAGILLSLPFGLYLSRVVPDPWGTPIREGLELLGVVPEHFLIFGVTGALLLPGCTLRQPEGARHTCAQEAFAVAATAMIFGLVHVGGQHPSVVIASFALGVINAYVTIRTASIWPAIAAHWIMNIVPMLWDVSSR